MLALRDQENLVHGHQTAAASKPLNQQARQLAPKTPGNRVPKTPFKIPLNDENGANPFGGGKGGLKTGGKGNENLVTGTKKGGLGDKNAFVTPMGPGNRAPLGQKTTNAKARLLQTPAPGPKEIELGKSKQKSVTARKPKPRVSHAEPVKIDVLNDQEDEEREIEYAPPRQKDLPDIPDDIPLDLDFSVLKDRSLTGDNMRHFYERPDADGLSYLDRKALADKRQSERIDIEIEARVLRDFECSNIPCLHIPDCSGDECKDAPEIRRQAEEKYQATIDAKNAADGKRLEPTKPQTKSETKAPQKKVSIPKGPSLATSKRAAASLSIPRSAPTLSKPTSSIPQKAKLPTSILPSRTKKTPLPTNPSPMRHTAAVAASNTTIGYSKGRVASATLRQNGISAKAPPRETEVKKREAENMGNGNGNGNGMVGTGSGREDLERMLGIGIFRGMGVGDVGNEVDEYEAEAERRAEENWRQEVESDFELVL